MRVAVVSCDMVPPGSSKLPAIVAFVNYLLGFFALPFFQDGRLTTSALQGSPILFLSNHNSLRDADPADDLPNLGLVPQGAIGLVAGKVHDVVRALLEGGLDHRDGPRGITQGNVELRRVPAAWTLLEPMHQPLCVSHPAGAGVAVGEKRDKLGVAVAHRDRALQG